MSNGHTPKFYFQVVEGFALANDFTRRIHDRMPVLLGHHDLDAWLTGKAGAELLRPAPNELLRMGSS